MARRQHWPKELSLIGSSEEIESHRETSDHLHHHVSEWFECVMNDDAAGAAEAMRHLNRDAALLGVTCHILDEARRDHTHNN